jgi:xanthine dehydrogenase YagS FAD-binding subunit
MRPFTYQKAATAADAVRAIAAAGTGTRFLAGGTTLYDLMKLNVEAPSHIVDINSLSELQAFDTSGSSELVFGALARMSDVAADPRLIRDYPALSARESCIAVYPGDFAVALVAFDAKVDVLGPGGRRTIELEHLHREPGSTPHLETMLEPGELILRIRVPMTPLGRASTYHKIRDRESYAFALASAAVALRMDGDSVRDVRIAIGGLGTRPWRARAAEQALRGRALTPETARAAGDAALQGAKAGRDNAFRIELGARTVADALMIASRRT